MKGRVHESDGAAVDIPEHVATNRSIGRTDAGTGAAADAAQRIHELGAITHRHAAVVHEDDVKGGVGRFRSGDERDVRGDRLSGGGGHEQLELQSMSMESRIFSMPATTIWTGGTLVTSSAFPSLVTSITVPDSATSALAPEIPTWPARNSSRRAARATATCSAMLTAAHGLSRGTLEQLRHLAAILVQGGADDVRRPFSGGCQIHSPGRSR